MKPLFLMAIKIQTHPKFISAGELAVPAVIWPVYVLPLSNAVHTPLAKAGAEGNGEQSFDTAMTGSNRLQEAVIGTG